MRGIKARRKMIAGRIQNDAGFSRNLFKMEEIGSQTAEKSFFMKKRSIISDG
jgi:hypothetical protein